MDLPTTESVRAGMIFHLDEDTYNNPNTKLFNDEILANGWIIFHGTSSVSELQIESTGFGPQAELLSQCDIHKVLSILDVIDANELDVAPNLFRNWSDEFEPNTLKPVYFGETATRCTNYAVRDYAGGEAYFLFREITKFLHGLLRDVSCLAAYRQRIWKRFAERILRSGLKKIPRELKSVIPEAATAEQIRILRDFWKDETGQDFIVWDQDLEWLSNELESISELRDRSERLWSEHRHGVIFAVRFQESDIERLESRSGMGIVFKGTIMPERIVAKTIIPPTVGKRWESKPRQVLGFDLVKHLKPSIVPISFF